MHEGQLKRRMRLLQAFHANYSIRTVGASRGKLGELVTILI
ncbi:hypothetical protein NEOC65_002118 [Neochlamydia sp. AcF65]|nr:hypothetical protein [Neochlamydia sp. AcF65]